MNPIVLQNVSRAMGLAQSIAIPISKNESSEGVKTVASEIFVLLSMARDMLLAEMEVE